jgi:signal transduction histidine kinase
MTRAAGTRRLPSVRMRTTLVAVAVVGVALAVAGLAVVWVLSASLTGTVDASARLRADAIANLAAGGTLPNALAVPGDDSILVQVIDTTGRVVASSANVADEGALVRAGPGSSGVRISTVSGLPVGEQGAFRLVSQSVATPHGRWTVVAAASLGPARHTLSTVIASLAVGLPILLVLVGLTVWLLAGRALAPVEAMRNRVADISSRSLDRRVPDPGGRDEIARLAGTMNDMLARLEDSQLRQRRFVADASHELRNPLASALTEVEVDLAHPGTADWPATAARVRTQLQRLQSLVADLLGMARVDAGAVAPRHEPVDLDELVRSQSNRLRATSPVPIDTSAVDPVRLLGNRDELGRALANLIENAARHARSHVLVSLVAGRDGAELVVADDGPGIPIHQQDLIFEPFARLDDSRSREDGGTGLGLSIVKDIVTAHGGTISVDDNGPGARFRVRLPRHDVQDGLGPDQAS